MPCKSCGGSKKANVLSVKVVAPLTNAENKLVDNDMVLISYENPNRGMHKVIGATTKINYGYREGGGSEKFYVHKLDIASQPTWFKPFTPPAVIIEQAKPAETPPPEIVAAPDFIETKPASEPLPPEPIPFKPLDLQSIPGVSGKIAQELQDKGVKSWGDIVMLGIEGLKTIEGIGERRAATIMEIAKKNAEL